MQEGIYMTSCQSNAICLSIWYTDDIDSQLSYVSMGVCSENFDAPLFTTETDLVRNFVQTHVYNVGYFCGLPPINKKKILKRRCRHVAMHQSIKVLNMFVVSTRSWTILLQNSWWFWEENSVRSCQRKLKAPWIRYVPDSTSLMLTFGCCLLFRNFPIYLHCLTLNIPITSSSWSQGALCLFLLDTTSVVNDTVCSSSSTHDFTRLIQTRSGRWKFITDGDYRQYYGSSTTVGC